MAYLLSIVIETIMYMYTVIRLATLSSEHLGHLGGSIHVHVLPPLDLRRREVNNVPSNSLPIAPGADGP